MRDEFVSGPTVIGANSTLAASVNRVVGVFVVVARPSIAIRCPHTDQSRASNYALQRRLRERRGWWGGIALAIGEGGGGGLTMGGGERTGPDIEDVCTVELVVPGELFRPSSAKR